jgi:DNA-binding GntR family transcriptional regulator
VSRGPIRSALKVLAATGLVKGMPNRGYVLARSTSSRLATTTLSTLGDAERHYRRIAGDRLDGRLPDTVTEAELMRRYDIGRPELLRLLDRIAAEGWIIRLPGYGWRFAETLASKAAYAQACAFRAVIEPAALLEPAYCLDVDVIERLASQQRRLLEGDLERLTLGEVFRLGCDFHEELVRGADNVFFVESLKRVNAIRRLFAYRTLDDHDYIRRHIGEHLRLLDMIKESRTSDAASYLRRHLWRSPKVRGTRNS